MAQMGTGAGIYSLKSVAIEHYFPGLVEGNYLITSHQTPEYNCIAWASEDAETWWWPDKFNQYYWPPSVPRTETVDSFIHAYALQGYEACPTSDYENGFEKIAIYTDAQGKPTHAARQLSSGHWTSKLGRLEDIEHITLEGLCGDLYGTVALVMKRPKVL